MSRRPGPADNSGTSLSWRNSLPISVTLPATLMWLQTLCPARRQKKSRNPPPPFVKPRQPSPFRFRPHSMQAKQPKSQSQQTLCAASNNDGPPQAPATAPAAIDFQALAASQQSCPEVAAMSSSPSLQIVRRPAGDAHLLGDISTGTFRPLVPPIFRQTVIRSLHEVHHPGVRATTRLVKASFCWPKMG